MAFKHDGTQLQCEKCDYQSALKQSLKLHIQSKHDGIGYACGECDQCSYRASKKQNLEKHMQEYLHENGKD